MFMVVKMMMMTGGVLCVRERVKERERQRDSKHQNILHYRNDRQREEKTIVYIHTPCHLFQYLQYNIPYY